MFLMSIAKELLSMVIAEEHMKKSLWNLELSRM
jgi:hypothetical protein